MRSDRNSSANRPPGRAAITVDRGGRLPAEQGIGSLRDSHPKAVGPGFEPPLAGGRRAGRAAGSADRRVGRLASEIAMILMGKHRPTYTPHVDTGDHVVVINAEKVSFSGRKWQQKVYRWYTGYMGLRSETAEHRRDRRPELIIEEAVRRMLPKSRLGRVMLDKLKVYAGSEHPHQAQQPEPIQLGACQSRGPTFFQPSPSRIRAEKHSQRTA